MLSAFPWDHLLIFLCAYSIAQGEGDYNPLRSTVFDIGIWNGNEGKLAKYATIREVKSVPVTMPTIPGIKHNNYLRTEPGLYPDLLLPPAYNGNVYIVKDQLKALWIEIDLRNCFEKITAGESELELFCFYAGQMATVATVTVEIVDALLPEQELIMTQ